MLRKIIVVTLLALMSFPCFAFAREYDSSVDGLVTSMDSVCDVSIGNNLELLRQAFREEPYSQKWYPRYKADERYKQHLIYTHMLNTDPEAGYDINRTLFIDADSDGTINNITYILSYRTNGIYYSGMLKSLIKEATNKFGTPLCFTGQVDGRDAQFKTWTDGDRKLSIVTYYTPNSKFHPNVIRIIRS